MYMFNRRCRISDVDLDATHDTYNDFGAKHASAPPQDMLMSDHNPNPVVSVVTRGKRLGLAAHEMRLHHELREEPF